MKYDILIFKGTAGAFVSVQEYEGSADFPEKITLDNEPYELTVFPYGSAQYLVAHNEPINKEAVISAITAFQPAMLN